MYFQNGAKYTGNSAFGNVNREYLIKLSQELILIKNDTEQRTTQDGTLIKQSAEWGMRAFQLLMPCIKDWMKCEECGEKR
jgi:hypothetical protein